MKITQKLRPLILPLVVIFKPAAREAACNNDCGSLPPKMVWAILL
jgi:hypothetical protein